MALISRSIESLISKRMRNQVLLKNKNIKILKKNTFLVVVIVENVQSGENANSNYTLKSLYILVSCSMGVSACVYTQTLMKHLQDYRF